MRYLLAHFILALVAVIAVFTSLPQQTKNEDDGSYIPSKLIIQVGGFFGTSYKVELRNRKLHYRSEEHLPKGQVIEKIVTPTKEQWLIFRKGLDTAQLWDWSHNYPNPGVGDGTQWSINIDYNGRSVVAAGDNNYPLEKDVAKPNRSPEPSLPFKLFVKAVRDLLGNLPFE